MTLLRRTDTWLLFVSVVLGIAILVFDLSMPLSMAIAVLLLVTVMTAVAKSRFAATEIAAIGSSWRAGELWGPVAVPTYRRWRLSTWADHFWLRLFVRRRRVVAQRRCPEGK